MKAFAIFEGGGAKGYAHIGGLRAAEDRGITFAAVAGTSIGALIACLIAAGYNSRELFETNADGTSTGILSVNPIDQLDHTDWSRFKNATRFLSASEIPFGRSLRSFLKAIRKHFVQIWIWTICLIIPLMTLLHLPLVSSIFRNFGLTKSEGLRALLDAALRAKITPGHGRPIKFSDLRIPLKVIAADLVSEQIVVFPRTPDDCVVDAVIASATFPIFFEPSYLDGLVLVDGGILSNRPAWVFDEERSSQTEAIPTFAFLLTPRPLEEEDVKPSDPPNSLYSFLVKILRTTAFGRQRLETRAVDDYFPIELGINVGTLSLEEAFAMAGTLIASAKADTERFFDKWIGPREPHLMKEALTSLGSSLYRSLITYGVAPGLVQCAIVMRTADGLARISYASYQPTADYGVSIRLTSPGPATCFKLREPVLTLVDEIPLRNRANPFFKYEHALRDPGIKTVYSIPIFQDSAQWNIGIAADRAEPIAVLAIGVFDNAADYFAFPEVEDAMASYAQVLAFGLSAQASSDWLSRTVIRTTETQQPSTTWTSVDGSDAFLISDRTVRNIDTGDGVGSFFDGLPKKFILSGELAGAAV